MNCKLRPYLSGAEEDKFADKFKIQNRAKNKMMIWGHAEDPPTYSGRAGKGFLKKAASKLKSRRKEMHSQRTLHNHAPCPMSKPGPPISWNATVFGDKALKEMIQLERVYYGGP